MSETTKQETIPSDRLPCQVVTDVGTCDRLTVGKDKEDKPTCYFCSVEYKIPSIRYGQWLLYES